MYQATFILYGLFSYILGLFLKRPNPFVQTKVNNYKTIGIIGGQGPTSSADFYTQLIKYFQKNFKTKYVKDFPRILISSEPSPDLVESVENQKLTFKIIARSIKQLEQNGADFIVIVCNSLQYLNPRFQKLVKIPIISIAQTVTQYLVKKRFKSVGILAANTTIHKKIYDPYLKQANIKLIKPNKKDQTLIEKIILKEYQNKITSKDTKILSQIAKKLHQKGAQSILLACTELPLIIKQNHSPIPIIDCSQIYLQETARLASLSTSF